MAFNNSSFIFRNHFRVEPFLAYVFCSLNGMTALLAFVGNSLVLTAFFRTTKLRKCQTNYFIASLAVADLIVACATIPMWSYLIADNFSAYVTVGQFYSVYQVFDVFSTVASIHHLMFISLERYFAIVWPVIHHMSTPMTYYIFIAFVWCISIFASCFSLEASHWKRKYLLINFVFMFGIPLIVIAFSYLSIFRATLRRFRSTSRRSTNKELKVASTIFILIVLFIITWSPFFVFSLVRMHCMSCNFSINWVLLIKFVHFTNSFCNPIVYAARIPDYRKAFSNMLPKRLFQILCCRTNTPSDNRTSSRTRASSAMSVPTPVQGSSSGRPKEGQRSLYSAEYKNGAVDPFKDPRELVRSTRIGESPECSTSLMSSSIPLSLPDFQQTTV